MTAEHIHDALTLLPADLIAEVDRKREQRPKVLLWKRYAAMAACFALILCSGWFCTRLFQPKGAMESMKEEAAVMQAAQEPSVYAAPEAEAAAAPAEANDMQGALPAASAQEESASEDVQSDTTANNSAATGCSAGLVPVYVNTPSNPDGAANRSSEPRITLIGSQEELESYLEEQQAFILEDLVEAFRGYDADWFVSYDLLVIAVSGVPVDDLYEVTAVREVDGMWEICMETYLDSSIEERTNWHILFKAEKGLIESEDKVTLVFE